MCNESLIQSAKDSCRLRYREYCNLSKFSTDFVVFSAGLSVPEMIVSHFEVTSPSAGYIRIAIAPKSCHKFSRSLEVK